MIGTQSDLLEHTRNFDDDVKLINNSNNETVDQLFKDGMLMQRLNFSEVEKLNKADEKKLKKLNNIGRRVTAKNSETTMTRKCCQNMRGGSLTSSRLAE